MILYCDYCGTVFGADVEDQPDRAFCSPVCEHLFGSGPTLPPGLADGIESAKRGEIAPWHDFSKYADDDGDGDPLSADDHARNKGEYLGELAEAREDWEANR